MSFRNAPSALPIPDRSRPNRHWRIHDRRGWMRLQTSAAGTAYRRRDAGANAATDTGSHRYITWRSDIRQHRHLTWD
jgi:hypothetical protein